MSWIRDEAAAVAAFHGENALVMATVILSSVAGDYGAICA